MIRYKIARLTNYNNGMTYCSNTSFIATVNGDHYRKVVPAIRFTFVFRSMDPSKESHPREHAIFTSVDLDGDGSVTREELRQACKNLGEEQRTALLASSLDEDGDGTISFKEWVQVQFQITIKTPSGSSQSNHERMMSSNKSYSITRF